MVCSIDEIRREMEQQRFIKYRIKDYCPHCGKKFVHNIIAKNQILNFDTEWEKKK